METENKVTILYVDDEPINLYLFQRVITRYNYNVITALSGDQGLQLLEQHKNIPIIVSDMRMPGMDGIEFIRLAKQRHPNALFFILTGFDLTPDIENAMKEQLIVKYMQKPFDQNEVDNAIKQALKDNNINPANN